MTMQIKIRNQMNELIRFARHLLIIVSQQKSSIFSLKKSFSILQKSSIFSLKKSFSILQKSSILSLKKSFLILQKSSIFSLKKSFSVLQKSSIFSLQKSLIFSMRKSFSTHLNMLRTMKFIIKNLMLMQQIRELKRSILTTITMLKKIFVAILKQTASISTMRMWRKTFLHNSNSLIIIWKIFEMMIINLNQRSTHSTSLCKTSKKSLLMRTSTWFRQITTWSLMMKIKIWIKMKFNSKKWQ